MKILVTGATGLVGKYLVTELLATGYEINYLTTQKLKLNSLPNCTGFLWDLKTQTIDENCIDGVTVIIHLAGANIGKRWTKFYKKEIIESRVKSTQLLYKLLQQNTHQIQQFVTASGVGIYKSSLTENYNEDSTKFGTGFLAEVVQKWEHAADNFNNLNIKVSKIRTGVVLAKKEGALVKMMQPIKMGFGAVLGTGKQQMSWIHVNDLVRLYVFVVQHKLEGSVNAVAPQVVTNAMFTQILAKQLHKKIRFPNVPKFMLQLLLGEMHLLLCESQKVSSNKIQKIGFEFQYLTATEAISNLLP